MRSFRQYSPLRARVQNRAKLIRQRNRARYFRQQREHTARHCAFAIAMLTFAAAGLFDGAGRTRAKNKPRVRMVWEQRRASLSDAEFRRTYRVDYELFHQICAKIYDDIKCKNPNMIRAEGGEIFPEIKLSMTLRWLAGGSYLDIYQMHGVSESEFRQSLWDTLEAIDHAYSLEFPIDDVQQLREMEQQFRAKSDPRIRGCVGAIDGCAIKIVCPSLSDDPRPARFYCRKGFYALNLQAMCDANRRFTAIFIQAPGSTNDALAWKYSELYRDLESGKLPGEFWIAGDAAYGNTPYLLCPFPGRNLRPDKDAFNFFHSQLRINIECAFGMLVNRWGILWKPLRCRLNRAGIVVGVCMKLHNLILDQTGGRGYGSRAQTRAWEYDCTRVGDSYLWYKVEYASPVLGKDGEPVDLLERRGAQRGAVTDDGRRGCSGKSTGCAT